MNCEKINRLISFVKVKCSVDAIYLENNYQNANIINLYIVTEENNLSYTKNKIIEYTNQTLLFDFTYEENMITYFIDGGSLLLMVRLSTIFDFNYNDYEMIFDNRKINRNDKIIFANKYANTLNKMFINIQEFYLYYNAKDYVKAFCLLGLVNDLLIRFLCLHYNYDENVKLQSIYQKMTKEKFTEFENLQRLFSLDNSIECMKIIFWFLNDYLINIPISILSNVNIDLYYELKSKIIEL